MRKVSFWALYGGVVLLVAAVALPFVRPQWNDTRGWVAAAGALLVLASAVLRLDFGRRVTRYGLHSIVLIVLGFGLVAFVEAVSYRHNTRIDLTENSRHSLSPQTIQLLKNLKTDVAATAFFQSDQPGKTVAEDLLKQYASHSNGRFTWSMADPDRKPDLARQYNVEQYGTIVLGTRGKSEKILVVEEEKLTNGLVKLTREGRRTVYVVRGHGEREVGNTDRQGLSEARAAMEQSHYEVKELALAREGKVPADAAAVIVPGPRTDFFPPEIDALNAYLSAGGKLFVMADPSYLSAGDQLSVMADPFQGEGLKKFLEGYGLTLEDDLVVEPNPIGRLFGIGPEVPIVQQYEQHPITRDLRGLSTLFPLTRSIKPRSPAGRFTVQLLARTSPQSWGETDRVALRRGEAKPDPRDPKGPLAVAAVATAGKARLVVFGTSSLASNQFLNIQGNRDLFLNTVSWLAEQEDLISIRPKDSRQTPVMLTALQGQAVFLLPVVVLPGIALIAGIVVLARRRASS